MDLRRVQFDLNLSVQRGLWATQPHNEPVLDQAYRTSTVVYLIFGVNKSGEFFGYAKWVFSIPIQHRASLLIYTFLFSGWIRAFFRMDSDLLWNGQHGISQGLLALLLSHLVCHHRRLSRTLSLKVLYHRHAHQLRLSPTLRRESTY